MPIIKHAIFLALRMRRSVIGLTRKYAAASFSLYSLGKCTMFSAAPMSALPVRFAGFDHCGLLIEFRQRFGVFIEHAIKAFVYAV